MQISAAQNTSIAPYTLAILANSSFPENIKAATPPKQNAFFPATTMTTTAIPSQNVFLPATTMTITILPSLTWQQQIIESWNGFGSVINGFVGLVAAVIGIAGIIGGWFLRKSKVKNESA